MVAQNVSIRPKRGDTGSLPCFVAPLSVLCTRTTPGDFLVLSIKNND